MKIGYLFGTQNDKSASTRFRMLNNREELKDKNIEIEFFQKGNDYDILVFSKMFRPEHFILAKEYKNKGTKIVFDINDNHYISSSFNPEYMKHECIEFTKLADAITTSTETIATEAKKYNDKVFVIEDNVDYIPYTAIFVWQGLASNFKEFLEYIDVFKDLKNEGKEFIVVCFGDWKTNINLTNEYKLKLDNLLDTEFQLKEYNIKKFQDICTKSEAFLSPRNNNEWYKSKSFNRLILPLRLNTPCIISNIPSYLELKPYFNDLLHFVENKEQFKDKLNFFLTKHTLRYSCFTPKLISEKWQYVFEEAKKNV